MKIVLTTTGVAGDLFPMMPVASELARRGHEVSFCANPSFRETIEAAGFVFRGLGPRFGSEEYASHPQILASGTGGLEGLRHLMEHFVLPALPSAVEDLCDATQEADLVLTHPAALATPIAAERIGFRWMTLSVFPGLVPSRYTAPAGSPLPTLHGRVGRMLNDVAWRVGRWSMRREFDAAINTVRQRFGLAPAREIFLLGGLRAERVLVLCPEAYFPRPPDWPEHIVLCGFTHFDTPGDRPMPAGLREFLEAGEAPVLVSLGTSVALDPQAFYGSVEQALDDLGVRGLFLVGLARNLPDRPDPSHGYFEYVPLSEVLGDCVAAVHPGGFGTTAAILAAGIPSVVVPRAFDQPYNAARLESLGLGRRIPWDRLDERRLRESLGAILEDANLARRARDFSPHASLSGETRAADEIEKAYAAGR